MEKESINVAELNARIDALHHDLEFVITKLLKGDEPQRQTKEDEALYNAAYDLLQSGADKLRAGVKIIDSILLDDNDK